MRLVNMDQWITVPPYNEEVLLFLLSYWWFVGWFACLLFVPIVWGRRFDLSYTD